MLAHPAHHKIPYHPEQVVGQMAVCPTAHHNALFFGQVFSFPPQLRLEGNVEIRPPDFSLGGPSGSAVLAVAHSLCLDVQVVHSRQSGNHRQGPEHDASREDQLCNWLHIRQLLSGFQQFLRQKRKRRQESSILWKTPSHLLFSSLISSLPVIYQ